MSVGKQSPGLSSAGQEMETREKACCAQIAAASAGLDSDACAGRELGEKHRFAKFDE